MIRRVLVLALPALLALSATRAHADDPSALLDRAQHAVDEVDYEAARRLVTGALEAGSLSHTDLARAHQLAGVVAAAVGDDAGARDHFVRWILLAPGAQLGAEVSPKIAAPFALARDEADRLGAMTFDVEVTREPGAAVFTVNAHDPLNLAVKLRVRIAGAATESPLPSARVEVEDKVPLTAQITILDDRGDELATRDTGAPPRVGGDAPAGAVTSATASPVHHHRIPAVVRWPTWAAATVLAAGAGGYFAWQVQKDHDALDALNADSSAHTFDEARALEDRGSKHAMYANIGFGVAGAAALATVLTLVLDKDQVEVAPLVAPDGGGARATVHF
ncbi:MAG: hypothetical protein K8W52_38905 [Deltaproteobacteria bacterium]|nr:hypothetical protein [Deltaproteobacteria bacterium]